MRMRDLDEPDIVKDRYAAFASEQAAYARTQLVHDLSTALYGDSWARTESPREVWETMLREVRQLALERGRP